MSTENNELEYLRFFYNTADFGPADDDVRYVINRRYVKETGNEVPEGYKTDCEIPDDYETN